MKKIRDTLAWARAHKPLTLTLVAAGLGLVTRLAPDFPADQVAHIVNALLGM